MRMLLPHASDDVSLADSANLEALFDLAYVWPERFCVRANMAHSINGAIAGADGRSGTLAVNTPGAGLAGGDREVFRWLRDTADVVLVGAGTARAEWYRSTKISERSKRRARPMGAPAARLVVVSRSGALPLDLPALSPEDGRHFHTTVARIGIDFPSLETLLGHLSSQGNSRILCEGGPALLSALAESDLLSDMCSTVLGSWVLSGTFPSSAGPSVTAPQAVSLAAAMSHDDDLFLRHVRSA